MNFVCKRKSWYRMRLVLLCSTHFEALRFLHGLPVMGKMELSMVTELKLLVEDETRTLLSGHPSSDSSCVVPACWRCWRPCLRRLLFRSPASACFAVAWSAALSWLRFQFYVPLCLPFGSSVLEFLISALFLSSLTVSFSFRFLPSSLFEYCTDCPDSRRVW